VSLEPSENREEEIIDIVREKLKNLGLVETVSKSMVDRKYCLPVERTPVRIEHPLNEEMNHLRNSILLSLLQTADKNIRRKNEKISIFEAGKIFFYSEGEITEINSLGVLLTGINKFQSWNEQESNYDFYDIKGIAGGFFSGISKNALNYSQSDIPVYFDKDQALSAYSNGIKIGTFGKLSKVTADAFEIKQDVFCFEADINGISDYLENPLFGIKELSKYPKVIKDISVLIGVNENALTIENFIRKTAGGILTDVAIVDTYRGEQVEKDKKSYTFRMSFQSYEKTLSDKDIEKLLERIISGLKKDLNLEIR